MKKLFTILLMLSSIGVYSQAITVTPQDANTFFLMDGQRRLVVPYTAYMDTTGHCYHPSPSNCVSPYTNNNYFRNPNTFKWGDTLYETVQNTRKHNYIQGWQVVRKIVKDSVSPSTVSPNPNFKWTALKQTIKVAPENNSLTYFPWGSSGDTIAGIKYTLRYESDTILLLDRNFNRLGFIHFKKASSGVDTSFLCVSKIVVNNNNHFFMTGYNRTGGADTGYKPIVLRSLNRGRSWTKVAEFPYVDNIFKGEEPAIIKGRGDTMILMIRNDFGNATWISRSADGQTWGPAQFAFKGCNQPQIAKLNDSIIVVAGRLIGFASPGQPLIVSDDTTTHSGDLRGYNIYTNFGVSWDNGQNWYTYIVDKARVEAFAYKGDGGLQSEVGSPVHLSGDTMRFYWCSGYYSGYPTGSNSFGDWNYTDFIINKSLPGSLRFLGGNSAVTPAVYDSLIINNGTGKYASIDIDNSSLNITGNIDSVHIQRPVRINSPLGLYTKPAPGSTFDFRDPTGNSETFAGGGGNYRYISSSVSPGIKLNRVGTGLSSPSNTVTGSELGSISIGGYQGGLVDNFSIALFSAENFSSATTTGTNLFLSKPISGSATPGTFWYVDSINNTYIGNTSTKPVLLTTRLTVGGSLSVDSSIYIGNIRTTTATTVNVTAGDYMILVDATAGNVIVNLPPSNGQFKREIVIKKIDASTNTVTVDANGSELIDGSTTLVLPLQYDVRTIKNNNTAWWVK